MVAFALFFIINYLKEETNMSKIKETALELIGGTPLLKLNRYAKKR